MFDGSILIQFQRPSVFDTVPAPIIGTGSAGRQKNSNGKKPGRERKRKESISTFDDYIGVIETVLILISFSMLIPRLKAVAEIDPFPMDIRWYGLSGTRQSMRIVWKRRNCLKLSTGRNKYIGILEGESIQA